jgi:hypothetical protein
LDSRAASSGRPAGDGRSGTGRRSRPARGP